MDDENGHMVIKTIENNGISLGIDCKRNVHELFYFSCWHGLHHLACVDSELISKEETLCSLGCVLAFLYQVTTSGICVKE